MRKEIKRNLKIYACGLLSGAVLMVGASRYGKISKMEEKSPFVDEFPLPKLEQSFDAKDTKTVEQYTFDYYGGKITIQDDELLIYGFDENGNMYVEHGEKVEVPVENHQYILDQYISEQESKVYTLIEKKIKLKTNMPFCAYLKKW